MTKTAQSYLHEVDAANVEALINSLPGLHMILKANAPDFTIISVSDAYLKATAMRRQDMIGKGIGSLTPHNPKDSRGFAQLYKSLNEVLSSKKPHEMSAQKYDIKLKNGQLEERYWRPTHTPILDRSGNIQYIIHSVADVTREIHTARIERQYLDALSTKDVPVGILILRGPDYKVEFINPVICEMWDKTSEQAAGKGLFEVLPLLKGQGFEDLLESVMKTGIPYIGNEMPASLERRGRKETVYFDFVYTPLREGDGTISGIMVIATDSTARVISKQRVASERQRLREIFMQAPVSIAIFRGRDFSIELANPDMCELWGKKHEDVIGKPLLDALPEIAGQGFDNLLAEVVRTGKPYTGNETPVKLRRQGVMEEVYVNFVYEPINESSGKIERVMAVAMEVTEQVLSRQAVEASEERFRTLIEQSTDAIQLIDPEGKILYSSESVLRVLGYTPDELQGKIAAPFIHPDDLPYFGKKVEELVKTPGKRLSLEYRVKHKDGYYIWLETTGVNRLHDPKIRALVGNFRDITERKKLERQKDDFIGIATHELKTPVTSIKTYAQILERRFKKQGDTAAQENMAKINAQIDKLTALIGDLLDITKIESGKLELKPEKFSFDELVHDAVEAMQLTTERHKLVIEGSTGETIKSDKNRLEQVLINLMSNAIKYSPHTKKIEIHLSRMDKAVRASVRDYGVGIAKERQPHVFERFYRVSGPNLESFPGLGLGLYISSEIIKRLNGRIWVESDGKNGSTFCVELPIANSVKSRKRTNKEVMAEVAHE